MQCSFLSWGIPLRLEHDCSYHSGTLHCYYYHLTLPPRSVCLAPASPSDPSHLPHPTQPPAARHICQDVSCAPETPETVFSVTVSSFAAENYSLEATLLDRRLQLDKPTAVQASANAPVFFRFHFDDDVENVIFTVESEGENEDLPAVISLQNGSCPLYDLPSDVTFSGKYQTMRKRGYMHLSRERLGTDIYFVVVVEPERNCRVAEYKNFTIHATAAPSTSTYTWPLLVNAGVFLLLPFLAFWVFISIEWFRGFGFNERMPPQTWIVDANTLGGPEAAQASEPLQTLHRSQRSYGATDTAATGAARKGTTTSATSNDEYDAEADGDDSAFGGGGGHGHGARLDSRASVTSEPEPTADIRLDSGRLAPSSKVTRQWNTGINYTEDDVRILRGQQNLRVNHLTRKLPKTQEKKFGQYAYYLLTLVVFYALPVSQLVYSQLSHFNQGNEDLCYYNFLCVGGGRGRGREWTPADAEGAPAAASRAALPPRVTCHLSSFSGAPARCGAFLPLTTSSATLATWRSAFSSFLWSTGAPGSTSIRR